ncbi:C-type lectin-like, partial [Trinorchestia longiramus]
PDFYNVGEFCYFFSRENVTYKEAVNQCPDGSALAFPSSKSQRAALVAFTHAEKQTANQWYVDITAQNGEWFWSDGTEASEPDLGRGTAELCARLIVNTNQLVDTPCWLLYPFICQYE